jgi:hypothetical protein
MGSAYNLVSFYPINSKFMKEKYKKILLLTVFAVIAFIPISVCAQQGIIQQKNFPLLTAIENDQGVCNWIKENAPLQELSKKINGNIADFAKMESMKLAPKEEVTSLFLFSETEINTINKQLELFVATPRGKSFVKELKECEFFYKNTDLTNEEFIKTVITRELLGINKIIKVYGLGEKPHYDRIDSVSYDVNSPFYNKVVNITALNVSNNIDANRLFFNPSKDFALWLLKINYRDEATRFEPMEKGENAKAVAKVKKTDFSKYPYSVLLIPGAGPEIEGVPIGPMGMMRCELAASRYKKGLAPFLILSGGFVHPYQTPFCEAIEMKKKLIKEYGVPDSVIIIEPHARHTTTNFRNAARLMIKYGIPTDKKALCTTTVDQSFYITNLGLDKRCERELGYVPYRLAERLNRNDVEFYVLPISLTLDCNDPLDP